MTIKATIHTDGPFISLAFEVRPPGRRVDPQVFGPVRLATVEDAAVLLSQVARYLDEPAPERP